MVAEISTGDVVIEGKTKKVLEVSGYPSLVVLQSKDDITAGDGARHDVIQGKAALANATTCNVFNLLQACGIPLAYQEQLDAMSFLAKKCDMKLLEVVIRREAHGSFLRRHPYLKRGHIFPQLVLEFFLKTKDLTWKEHSLPKDDPFIDIQGDKALLFRPDQPIYDQEPFLTLDDFPTSGEPEVLQAMGELARETFLVLEKAWQILGRRLVDFKVEFGIDGDGQLLLADVIDNDSWRVVEGDDYIDKQVYRDGAQLSVVEDRYQLVRGLTERFTLPRQRIILWRGSETDDLGPFVAAVEPYTGDDLSFVKITRSMHRDPIRGYQEVMGLVQEVPDSVLITYVGRSNGAGPTLSASVTIPTISVPAGWRDFPEDVWSSLRTPSEAPASTILDPGNAIPHALGILAMRNPRVYAQLRLKQERRLANVVLL